MESLRAMFPDRDRAALQAALDAHAGSLERTVDYLLAADAAPVDPPTRRLQEAHDEALARRLQQEEDAFSDAFSTPHNHHHHHHPPPSHPSASPLPIPSMQDVSNAVRPIVDSVATAGRAAAQHLSQLYNDYVAPSPPPAPRRYAPVHDDSTVLRAQHDSPTASGAQRPRRRATHPHSAASSSSKKDA